MLDQNRSESTPTVSVIMPCYNQGQYIDEAINSVLKQTFQSFEIIVINDGSTDQFTIEHLKSSNYSKTRVIHTANQGVSAARNQGIQAARGRYILPLDADDCITPTYLEHAVPILDNQLEVGIVYGQAELFGESTGFWDLSDYQFPEILLNNVIFNSALFRRTDWEIVEGYRSNMIYGYEDYDFWLSLIELDRKVVRLSEVVYLYRQRTGSRNNSIQFEQSIKCYTQIFYNHIKLYTDNISSLFRAYLTYQAREHEHTVQLASASEETQQTQTQLQQARTQIQQAQTQLQQTQTQLQQTQTQLQQTQTQLQQTQTQLQQTQTQLQQTQTQLQQTQTQLQQTQTNFDDAQTTIAAMKNSKSWKLRQAWIRMRTFLLGEKNLKL